MDVDKVTALDSSSKQYYLEKRQAPQPWIEQENAGKMQKKGRNTWHYLAMQDNIFEGMEGERRGIKYKIIDTEDKYNLDRRDINATDRYGNTPLHYAYAYARSSTINALLAKGANPDIKNHRGQKPGEQELKGLASLKNSLVQSLPNAWLTSAASFISSGKRPETAVTTTATQEQFVAEVKNFKQVYGIKSLKDEAFSPFGRDLYKRFITNPVIMAWLTRSFDVVQFREDGAPMVDKYEIEFYDGIASYSIQLCGSLLAIDSRAIRGYEGIWHYYGGLSAWLSVGLMNSQKMIGGEEKGVIVKFPHDIYGAGDDALGGYGSLNSPLLSITNIIRANKYSIYWTAQNDTTSGHQITCVTKHDNKGAAAAVFLLNSWQESEPEVDESDQAVDGGAKTPHISANKGYSKYLEERFKHNTYHRAPAPYTWIDVSHNIQTADDDKNCAIYSLNFCKAIKEFLTTPAYRIQMDTYCNAGRYKEAGTYLSNGIKALMPQYYRANGNGVMVAVSPDALKQYHLEYRWNLGNEAIHRLHDLAMI